MRLSHPIDDQSMDFFSSDCLPQLRETSLDELRIMEHYSASPLSLVLCRPDGRKKGRSGRSSFLGVE